MYDTASRLCQVGNKYAFWYMKHKSWVQCAPNLPGYRMLTNTGPDWQGNWWYTPAQAKEVRFTTHAAYLPGLQLYHAFIPCQH